MKDRKKINVAKELEIPQGIARGYFMEIHSGKEVVLNGKCDVLVLEDSVLKIKIDEHGITFHGRGLCIDLYNADGIIISGDICTVELD